MKIKEITEPELINKLGGAAAYIEFCTIIGKRDIQTKEFKSSNYKYFVSNQLFEIEDELLMVYYSINRELLPVLDVSIKKAFLGSKEDLTDTTLDFYNTWKGVDGADIKLKK